MTIYFYNLTSNIAFIHTIWYYIDILFKIIVIEPKIKIEKRNKIIMYKTFNELCESCYNKVSEFYIMKVKVEDTDRYKNICYNCVNNKIAFNLNVDFLPLRSKSVIMRDKEGEEHFFRLRKRIYSEGFVIEAVEFQEGNMKGYKFEVDGELECNQSELEDQMLNKIQKELFTKYIGEEVFFGKKKLVIKDGKVTGRIESNLENDEGIPILVIDGKEYSWNQIGRMLRVYEGFEFKIEMID